MSDQGGGALTDTFVDVSHAYGHLRCFRDLLPLVVRTNPHTYIPVANGGSGTNPEDGHPARTTWLGLALTGMEELRARRPSPVRSVAVVGTGGGLDAAGISRIFAPEEMIASDLHAETLGAARWNIAKYARPTTRCRVLRSDLFGNYPEDARFDLVYENLPNIPDEAELLEGIRSASCYRPASYAADPVNDRFLLTLHANCLREARPFLRPGASVVCMIGGRVSWRVINEMFAGAGYAAAILHFGVKTQSEPGVVLEGYALAERNGSPPFIYYHPVEGCAKVLAGDPRAAQPGEALGARVERLGRELEALRVSAADALRLHEQGRKVCHSVYVIEGTPR